MIPEEVTVFPKQIKLDDYGEFNETNVVRILETSNILVGSGARTSNAVLMLQYRLLYSLRHFIFKPRRALLPSQDSTS
jgi:hypothetical protein